MATGDRYSPYRKWEDVTRIPDWLMGQRKLSAGAKLCFARLIRFAGKNGQCFPKQATLAEALGVSDRQVRDYLAELERHGLIATAQGGRGRGVAVEFIEHPWEFGASCECAACSVAETRNTSSRYSETRNDRSARNNGSGQTAKTRNNGSGLTWNDSSGHLEDEPCHVNPRREGDPQARPETPPPAPALEDPETAKRHRAMALYHRHSALIYRFTGRGLNDKADADTWVAKVGCHLEAGAEITPEMLTQAGQQAVRDYENDCRRTGRRFVERCPFGWFYTALEQVVAEALAAERRAAAPADTRTPAERAQALFGISPAEWAGLLFHQRKYYIERTPAAGAA